MGIQLADVAWCSPLGNAIPPATAENSPDTLSSISRLSRYYTDGTFCSRLFDASTWEEILEIIIAPVSVWNQVS